MRFTAWVCLAVSLAALPSSASAWSPLRAENPNVKRGNALMAEERAADALDAYDEAARELPQARAVQLNRGLALLAQDLTEQAKEAFTAAADPSAAASTRADAYYNLGIAQAREGDALAQQQAHEEASTQFREAADSFKRALRQRPGDRNAAWNLEYALQRIREEEQKQEAEQQDQEPQQDQDQDQDQQQDQDQDQQQGQDQQQDQDQQNESENESEPEQDNEAQSAPEPQPSEQPMARDDVQRFLDALEQNEQNLPLERARHRSSGRRPPEKDW